MHEYWLSLRDGPRIRITGSISNEQHNKYKILQTLKGTRTTETRSDLEWTALNCDDEDYAIILTLLEWAEFYPDAVWS